MRYLRIAWLAFEGLRRTRLRTTLTTLGVAIASAALVSMVAFAVGLQYQVEAPFRMLALLNNIQVMPHEGERAKDAPALDEAAITRLGEIPGVVSAYPDIRAQGVTFRHGDKTVMGLAIGIPREAGLFGVEEDIIVAGHFFSQSDKPEAIIGTALLPGLGFKSPQDAIGQSLTLEATGFMPEKDKRFSIRRKKLTVEIVGVYEAPPLMPSTARGAVAVPVELMKEVPGIRVNEAVSLLTGADPEAAAYAMATVRVRDPASIERVAQEIREMGYNTKTVVSRLNGMRTFFVFLQVLLAAVGTVALVVAALGIVNTLVMSVLERYEEIGLYKAIGASDGDLAVMFLTEAATFGVVGGIGGLGLGRVVSWLLGIAINIYARHEGATEPLDLFAFPAWLLVATVLFSLLVSVLAGVYPAIRAARVDPIRALRRA